MERCPVCRARFRGDDQCRRCQADLGTLKRIAREADELMTCAVEAARRGAFQQAHELACRSQTLRKTDIGRCVAGFASAMMKSKQR